MPFHIPFRFLYAAMLFFFACLGSARCAELADWAAVSKQLGAATTTTTDFTPGGTQPGLAFPILGPTNCAGCHAASASPFSPTYRPHPTWSGSMMANATRDPLFWAALDVANNDVPGVGDFCLRCHATKGWSEGRVVKNGHGGANDAALGAAGCLLLGNYAHADDDNSDFSGVACHYCHRANTQLSQVGNGVAVVDDFACSGSNEPCRHGPYFYPQPGFLPPHPTVHDLGFKESRFCGTCHNVSSPATATSAAVKTLVLNDGTKTDHPFPVERTFSEWQQSYYARSDALFRDGFQPDFPADKIAIASCQNCHMPDSGVFGATASTFPGTPDRTGDLPVHEFAGGNTWVPKILKGEFFASDATRSTALDQTVSRATALLQSSADLKVNLVSFQAATAGQAGSLKLQATVTNLSGHKLPTGYGEGRRMWLNVAVTDKTSGKRVFESAAYDPGTGILTRDANARVYETLQGIFNRNGTGKCDADTGGVEFFHFVLNDCIAKDTRIPPARLPPGDRSRSERVRSAAGRDYLSGNVSRLRRTGQSRPGRLHDHAAGRNFVVAQRRRGVVLPDLEQGVRRVSGARSIQQRHAGGKPHVPGRSRTAVLGRPSEPQPRPVSVRTVGFAERIRPFAAGRDRSRHVVAVTRKSP